MENVLQPVQQLLNPNCVDEFREDLLIRVPYSKVSYKQRKFMDSVEALQLELLSKGFVLVMECKPTEYHLTVRKNHGNQLQ